MAYIDLERLVDRRLERPEELTVVGIGALIVLKNLAEMDDSELKLLVVRQRGSKPETGKLEGSLSIIQETVKVYPEDGHPEMPKETLRGAMDEVIDAKGAAEIGHHLERVAFTQRPEIPMLSLPGMAGGIEVVVFSGPADYAFNPVDKDEVEGPPQWIKASGLMSDATARDTSLELLRHAISQRMLTRGMRQRREPVFPQGYNFEAARLQRERLPDITKMVRR